MSFDEFVQEMDELVDRTIRVDVRETSESNEMFELVKEKAEEYEGKNFNVVEEQLEVGDYAFKNVGIERKEKDYIKIDDVLTKAEELKANYDYAFILISQDLSMLKHIHKNRKQVDSLDGLTASLVAREVYPIFCSDRPSMVTVMLKLFDKITDEKDRTIREPIRPEPSTDDWKKHILMGLPHIGEKKAEKLMFNFDTVRDVMIASKDELKRVDGIGEKIAVDILGVINE